MGDFFENVKATMTKALKKAGKTITKMVLPIVLIILIAVIVVSGLVYELTRQDGSYKEGDMSNVPYASTKYTADVTIDENGKITTSMTAQELWDEMIKNNSRVDEYLDGPEDLLKLMNAEIITNYPDTRANPDEEIDWDTLNKNIDSNEVQGIIKFKRAKDDGSTVTMTYVDSQTFYEWIEYYNMTGDEATRENIITHFTIEKKANAATSTIQLDYNGSDIITDISEAIVKAAQSTPSSGAGLCQAWVRKVYVNAGLPDAGYIGAYQAFQQTCVSTDMNNIPIGAAVYGTGSASYNGGPNIYGHVGIYVGDIDGDGKGDVMDNISDGNGNGIVSTQSLESWIQWQVNAGNTACGGTPGWLGWGWQSGSPTQILSGGNGSSTPSTGNSNGGNNTNSSTSNITSLDNVLFIGDSITVGLDSSGLIPNATFQAESGTKPSDWLSRIDSLPQNADDISCVCVMLGVNNTSEIEEMKQLIDALSARYTGKTIFVQKVLPVANTYTYRNYQEMNESIKTYNDAISSYCNGKVNVKFIDTSEGYVDSSGAAKAELFDGEGLHPTNYQMLKENIEKAITGTTGTTSQIQNANSSSKYNVVVGAWTERFEERKAIGDVDPEGEYIPAGTTYTMTTQKIDYQSMVSGYTMPFDYLWALVVTGRDPEFALDLADLVYDSEIEITIHDNYTEITDVDTYEYTRKTKVHTHDITVTGSWSDTIDNRDGTTSTESGNINETNSEGSTDEILKNYTIEHTIITKTNTLDISLTKADVWIVKYTKNYTYEPETTETNDPVTSDLTPVEYPDTPDTPKGSDDPNGDPCGIGAAFESEVRSRYSDKDTVTTNMTCKTDYYYGFEGTVTNNNTVVTRKYTSSPAEIIEKTDKYSDEDNFVTLFIDNYDSRNNILSAPEWLFEILESNQKTVDMVDLTKYLLYKATGRDYGVTEYDFSAFDPKNFKTVSNTNGVLSITTTNLTREEFIAAVQGYSAAISKGSGTQVFRDNAGVIYDVCVKNNINPVLCAAQAWKEQNWDDPNTSPYNYWGIAVYNGQNYGNSYSSMENAVEGYCNQINSQINGNLKPIYQARAAEFATVNNKFKGDMSTMYDIFSAYAYIGDGHTLQEEADYAADYVDSLIQCATQIFGEGALVATSGGASGIIATCQEVMQEFLNRNARYSVSNLIWGNIEKCWTDSEYICCASYVSLVLYRSGALTPAQINAYNYHYTGAGGVPDMLQAAGWQQVSPSQAQPGDVVIDYGVHAMIYAGNGQVWDQASCVISSSGNPPTRGPRNYNISGCQVWRAPSN